MLRHWSKQLDEEGNCHYPECVPMQLLWLLRRTLRFVQLMLLAIVTRPVGTSALTSPNEYLSEMWEVPLRE